MTIRTLAISTLCASVLALTGCQTQSHQQSHQQLHQQSHASHHMMQGSASPAHHNNQSKHAHTRTYQAGMERMHDDMMQGMKANDADVAFAKGMSPHHVGAIEMAKVQLRYGKDAQMRQLARDIIKAQDKEIKQMEQWLAIHPDTKKQSYTDAMQRAYHKSMQPMHEDMIEGIKHPNPDMAFAKGMLPHHEGAIAMARVQLAYGKDTEMLRLARDIIEAQESEIVMMQNWINAHK